MKDLDKLILEISQGKKESLRIFYDKTKKSVYAYALSILKSHHDAEDVMQDTYIAVYSSANQYKSQGKPLAWVMTITKNLALKKIRNYKDCHNVLEDFDDKVLSDDCYITSDNRILIETILSMLEEVDRQIVVLHAVSGLKHREIAVMLNIPLATVLSKYNRSLKKLNLMLSEGLENE